MKRVSLKQVANRCVKDPKFFRALLRGPQSALVRARMPISAKDLKKMKKLIADKGAMKDFAIYSKLIRKYTRTPRTPQGILW